MFSVVVIYCTDVTIIIEEITNSYSRGCRNFVVVETMLVVKLRAMQHIGSIYSLCFTVVSLLFSSFNPCVIYQAFIPIFSL